MKQQILEKQLEFEFMTSEQEKVRENWEAERKAFIQHGYYTRQLGEKDYE